MVLEQGTGFRVRASAHCPHHPSAPTAVIPTEDRCCERRTPTIRYGDGDHIRDSPEVAGWQASELSRCSKSLPSRSDVRTLIRSYQVLLQHGGWWHAHVILAISLL